MRPQVKSTCDQTLGQVDIWSDVPPDEALWQVAIWSDVPSRWGFGTCCHLVRCTPSEASGQVDILSDFRSGWHLVRLWVKLTYGQMYPQMRLKVRLTCGQTLGWSKVPLLGWGFRSDWHVVRLWVAQMYPQ